MVAADLVGGRRVASARAEGGAGVVAGLLTVRARADVLRGRVAGVAGLDLGGNAVARALGFASVGRVPVAVGEPLGTLTQRACPAIADRRGVVQRALGLAVAAKVHVAVEVDAAAVAAREPSGARLRRAAPGQAHAAVAFGSQRAVAVALAAFAQLVGVAGQVPLTIAVFEATDAHAGADVALVQPRHQRAIVVGHARPIPVVSAVGRVATGRTVDAVVGIVVAGVQIDTGGGHRARLVGHPGASGDRRDQHRARGTSQ